MEPIATIYIGAKEIWGFLGAVIAALIAWYKRGTNTNEIARKAHDMSQENKGKIDDLTAIQQYHAKEIAVMVNDTKHIKDKMNTIVRKVDQLTESVDTKMGECHKAILELAKNKNE